MSAVIRGGCGFSRFVPPAGGGGGGFSFPGGLLEDFRGSSIRLSHDGTNPIEKFLVGDNTGIGQIQSGGLDTVRHTWRGHVDRLGSVASVGFDLLFNARGNTDNVSFPWGFLQSYLLSNGTLGGTIDWTAVNRLYLRVMRESTSVLNKSPQDSMQFGNYCKPHAFDSGQLGQHYYWESSGALFADEWCWVFLDRQSQFRVGSANTQGSFVYDPEFNAPSNGSPVHFFDGLTAFYVDTDPFKRGGAESDDQTWHQVDDAYFDLTDESSEPIFTIQGAHDASPLLVKVVATVTVSYSSTLNSGQGGYQVSWATPKSIAFNYRVAYKTSSMKASGGGTAGWSTGTWDGTTTTSGNVPYNGVTWTSPTPAVMGVAPHATVYFGIQPQTGTGLSNPSGFFTEVFYTSSGSN